MAVHDAVNLHSVAVAILADVVTQRRTANYAEGAFAAGLFHDLGQLLVALGLPKEYEEIGMLCHEQGKKRSEAETDVLVLLMPACRPTL